MNFAAALSPRVSTPSGGGGLGALRLRVPHLSRPLPDTVAPRVPVCIVVMPFIAIGLAYWMSASVYVTGEETTLDQLSHRGAG